MHMYIYMYMYMYMYDLCMCCRKYEPWCGYGERPTGLTVLSGRV